MSADYRIRPISDANEWQELFGAIDRPQLMQSYAYGEAKRLAEGWAIVRCVFERGSTPLALCQALEKRFAGLRLAARINRGPLFFEAAPEAEVKENVFRLLRKQWSWPRGGPLLIAPALNMSEENREILLRAGFVDRRRDAYRSARLDLHATPEELKQGLASTWRNRLKLAERSGLALNVSNSPASISWMLDRHVENMRAKNFRRPARKLVAALYQARPQDLLVLRAEANGLPLAGMLLAKYGRHSEYYIGWFGEQGRKVNCGNFLYWNAILESKKAGCAWFDVGGYEANEKYGHFKLGMHGAEYRHIGEWLSY